MSHKHELVRYNCFWALSPLDWFDFAEHCLSGHNSTFCDLIGVPCQEVASPNAAKSVVCPSNPLEHAIDRTWAFDLDNALNFSHVDT
jgi:hypothetical protein